MDNQKYLTAMQDPETGLITSSESETDFTRTTRYEGHGYETRLYQINKAGLKDKISVKPLEPDRPEIVIVGKEVYISFIGTYPFEEIPRIHQYLCDAEALASELKQLISEKNIIL